MTAIATSLPPRLVRYRQTSAFTSLKALLAAHSRYCLDSGTEEVLVVASGGTAVIQPEMPHHVEILDSAFRVEFHRTETRP